MFTRFYLQHLPCHIPGTDSPNPKRKSPFPRSDPGIPPPRFSHPVHCALGFISEVIESPPSPTISPASLPNSHPTIPIPVTIPHTPGLLPYQLQEGGHPAARRRGGKESLLWHRRHGTTPPHLCSQIAIVTYKKKPPHHERNCSLPLLFSTPTTLPVLVTHPERNPVPQFSSTHTLRETTHSTLGSFLLLLPMSPWSSLSSLPPVLVTLPLCSSPTLRSLVPSWLS